MDFEWDQEKDNTNKSKHNVGFVSASQIFEAIYVTAPDSRRDYGEKRHIAVGKSRKKVLVVVYTRRRKKIRIISARLANKKERSRYESFIAEKT